MILLYGWLLLGCAAIFVLSAEALYTFITRRGVYPLQWTARFWVAGGLTGMAAVIAAASLNRIVDAWNGRHVGGSEPVLFGFLILMLAFSSAMVVWGSSIDEVKRKARRGWWLYVVAMIAWAAFVVAFR